MNQKNQIKSLVLWPERCRMVD